ILVDLGSKVPVGTPLAVIRAEGEAKTSVEAPASPPMTQPVPIVAPVPIRTTAPPIAAPAGAVISSRASPAARRLAREHGVDHSTLMGTGPAGAVTYADVERRIA